MRCQEANGPSFFSWTGRARARSILRAFSSGNLSVTGQTLREGSMLAGEEINKMGRGLDEEVPEKEVVGP